MRLSSPFVQWQLRHAAVTAIGTRLVLTMALAWAQSGRAHADGSAFRGADTALIAILLATIVATFDRGRIGASTLMANLGYSRSVQAFVTAIPATVIELAINLAVFVS